MVNIPVEDFVRVLPETLALTRELVEIESPSTSKTAVDRLGQRLAQELAILGARIQFYPQAQTGNHLLARWGSGPGGFLLLFHMDTVFETGTIALRPFRQAGGHIYGPGALDMKSSIAMFLGMVRLAQQEGLWSDPSVTALFTTDEEIGSLTSRSLIESEARQARVVFCLEPAMSNGALKTARKGTGDITLKVKGVAAHAGVDHARGRNAIQELAYHILEVQKLTNYEDGTTLNTGLVRGGTRPNVVPEEALAVVDFRVSSLEELGRLQAWVQSRVPVMEGTSLEAQIQLNRPPMPRDTVMAASFQKASLIARELGLDLAEGSTGGGSDANFAAALGMPVLDGLGPVGGGAHSEREYVQVSTLPERAALLAALILNW